MNADEKFNNLISYLKELKSAAVAYSAGVDSTFLLKAAQIALGENLLAITLKSFSFPNKEKNEALEFCKKENIKHIVAEVNELEIEGFKLNPANRCYLCKRALFAKMLSIAKENGIQNVIEGSNTDDIGDYRPGTKAIKELDIKSPLKECGFTKNEIRKISEKLGLKTADKPSLACLSTRIPYGEEITKEKLTMINKAEEFLFDSGFKQARVRIHNNIARIEILEEEFLKLMKLKDVVLKRFKEIGFMYVTMDLAGYRTGSLNEVLKRYP